MPTNVFFNHAVQTEQHLYEDLVVEALRMYGHNVFYLPREIIEEDSILNEDVQSKFGDSYQVEMYIENTDGFEGEGDLMSKFGVQMVLFAAIGQKCLFRQCLKNVHNFSNFQ